MAKFQVTIDVENRELIPKYLNNRRKDIRSILRALGSDNFQVVWALGHSMKGSSATYSFQLINQICFKLEDTTYKKGTKQIQKSLKDLNRYLDCLDVVFE